MYMYYSHFTNEQLTAHELRRPDQQGNPHIRESSICMCVYIYIYIYIYIC